MDMRNNFHLKFKEWKDRKKYSQNSIKGYFSKAQNSVPPADAIQKKVVSNGDFEEEKKIVEEQKQKKRNLDVKLRQKTRNLNK